MNENPQPAPLPTIIPFNDPPYGTLTLQPQMTVERPKGPGGKSILPGGPGSNPGMSPRGYTGS